MTISKIESVIVWNGFRNFLFVAVHTDTGLAGVGESGLNAESIRSRRLRNPGRDWEPPQTRRVDGSITNW